MRDKVFIDSNVIIYLFSNDNEKKEVAKNVIKEHAVISIQVLNEVSNVLYKKIGMDTPTIKNTVEKLASICRVKNISLKTINSALDIVHRYKYSYYDSLIISSAIENQCSILYSEDMSDDHVVEKKLKILNPFK